MTNFDFDQASYGDLLIEAKRITSEHDFLQNKLMFVQQAFDNRDRQYREASRVVQELIENNAITDQEVIDSLVEVLDITLTRTVNFTVLVEVTGSMEVAWGEEISEYSFEIEQMSYDGNSVDVDYSSVTDLNYDFNE